MGNKNPRQPSPVELEAIRNKFYISIKDPNLYSKPFNIRVGEPNSSDTKDHLRVKFNKRNYLVHHIVWFLYYGTWPKVQIDHRDRNKQNNLPSNLRETNDSIQISNRDRPNKLPTGVVKHRSKKKYQAQIKYEGKYKYLGVFDTPEEAHERYKKEYKLIYGKDYE